MYAQKPRAPATRSSARVTAVLGPTNTGKTHFAVERMLAQKSGMIGLPLRLLAREVYDRVVKLKGATAAALITGEEKIIPPNARYFVCTTEAMPLDIGVGCLIVDEIQLCTDPERGHIFTDRLLHARGEDETMFLGSDTMRGAIQRFVSQAYFVSRARFSDLAYTGVKKLTRLPRRCAVVGFSADDVYGIAELIRRQRGGAAVVLGALSPRTRNAQVGLYQSGDVDFLVATDAIGMGLNMDVDHVAFAALEKFDGIGIRPLRPDEIGQIAGRAGRHMNDGTFGVTAEAEPMDDEIVARVESHRYDPVRVLQWRNSALQFHSLAALIESLDAPPPVRGLVKARPASDLIALRTLAAREEISSVTNSPHMVRRLWEVCQLPDFRKLNIDEHIRLIETIFGYLRSEAGTIPDDVLARAIGRLDQSEGDVATLSGRLAQIRTWTYASHRPGWVRDSAHWQEVTRSVEDRLSDALHERLTQRFVDRRTSVLMRKLRDDEDMHLSLDDSGGVAIGNESVGKLDGFRFTPDPRAEGIHGRTLRAATIRALEGEFSARARRLTEAEDKDIALSEHGKIWWDGAIVATLIAGPSPLEPRVRILVDEQLKPGLRDAISNKLEHWVARRLGARISPLLELKKAVDIKAGAPNALPAAARGIAHQLCQGFGTLDRASLDLPADLRPFIRPLRPFNVWFGRRFVYLPKLLRPDAASLLGLLWGVWRKLDQIPATPLAGLTSFANDGNLPDGFLRAAGFHAVAGRAIRLDMLERLEDELERGAVAGATADTLIPKLVSFLGCDRDSLEAVLDALGWHTVAVTGPEQTVPDSVFRRSPRRPQRPRPGPRADETSKSPFAGLNALIASR